MKLLIIGKSGQLGSALVKDALSLNCEVISPSKRELNIDDESMFRYILSCDKPDIIINTAAFNDTVLCERQPENAFKYNSIDVKNMASACSYNDFNIPFITFSTDYVFDGKKNKPYTETDTPFPLQIYGLSKFCGEHLSLMYDTTTVIRTSTLYGLNRSKNGKVNFIDKVIGESKIHDSIEVANNKFVSSTNAEDLSKAVLKLIMHPYNPYMHSEEKSNVYHLVNEGHCSMFDLAKETFNILNIDTELIPIKHKEVSNGIRRPLFSVLKNQKAKKIGIDLPYWKDSLKKYLEIKYKNRG